MSFTFSHLVNLFFYIIASAVIMPQKACSFERGFIELDNGYIITETAVANNGTAIAGLNYYETIDDLTKRKGNDIVRFTGKTKGSS